MSELSPIDASMLALIAENRKSPAQVKRLLEHTGTRARRIATIIVAPRSARVSKSDRKAANAIRHWAATNKA
jgi:hypothetical protein